MSKNQELNRCKEELDILENVIDYAERMVRQDKNLRYDALLRSPYEKVIVVEKENGENETFRISSTSLLYPNRSSGYTTALSPVGRLASVVQTGDKRRSSAWGEFSIVETRLTQRYRGEQLEPNLYNFAEMVVKGRELNSTIHDLNRTLERGNKHAEDHPKIELPASNKETESPQFGQYWAPTWLKETC